jgi:hypothetical protein
MSLVVLQRKSRRFQAPISGKGQNGFALNGTRRNIGAVGPTNLGKSVMRTPFRGSVPVGHGGCCGQYKVDILASGSCCINTQDVVKRSAMNTNAFLSQKKEFGRAQSQGVSTPNCACPKPEIAKTQLYAAEQGEYIRVKVIPGAAQCTFDVSNDPAKVCTNNNPGANFIGTIRQTNNCNIVKTIGPLDYRTYMSTFLMQSKCLPQPLSGRFSSSPKWINNDAC